MSSSLFRSRCGDNDVAVPVVIHSNRTRYSTDPSFRVALVDLDDNGELPVLFYFQLPVSSSRSDDVVSRLTSCSTKLVLGRTRNEDRVRDREHNGGQC
jgi:hypothetical protein